MSRPMKPSRQGLLHTAAGLGGTLLLEITTRLPGRGLSNLDVATLTDLAYVVARQQGWTPEEAAKDGALHMEAARR